ncbi:Tc5 transposase DNA-binding domain [Popillia japonica]|uniref:Tc5 transposase DNA-binding domain n=1 Tax=Popillia japonica TaxID=7064 RepID=A0AAW1L7I4_POPJA
MLPGFLAPQSVDDQIMDVYVANIVYPNIQNDRLPQRVGCYSADRTTIINAFRRYIPQDVQVEDIRYFKKGNQNCQWEVDYLVPDEIINEETVEKYSRIIKEPDDVIKSSFRLNGEGITIVYTIPPSTLTSILHRKDFIAATPSNSVKKRQKAGGFPELEKALVTWFSQCRQQNVPVSGILMKNLCRKVGYQRF